MSAAELRRLLELAAKAAGHGEIEYANWCEDDSRHGEPTINDSVWNPYHDDGDSRRLEVKLRLQVTVGRLGCGVSGLSCPQDIHEEFQPGCDELAVVRLAVLRASAAIGEVMP